MPENSNRDFVAFHEAGHATLDILFDHDIDSVTIVQDGDAAGRVEIDRSGDDALRYEKDTVKQVLFERRIMAAMAGEIAQRRFAPASVEEDHGASDRALIDEYLDELDATTPEIRAAYLRLLKLKTEALVEEHWPRVKRIAGVLLLHETVNAETIRSEFINPEVARRLSVS